jgi:hypothetical protein
VERPDDQHRRPDQDREDERPDDPAQEERRARGSAESSNRRIAAMPVKLRAFERSARILSRSMPPIRNSSAATGHGSIASRTEGVRGDSGFDGVGKIGPRRTMSAPCAAAARASDAECADFPTRKPRGVSRRTAETGSPASGSTTPAAPEASARSKRALARMRVPGSPATARARSSRTRRSVAPLSRTSR